MSDPSPDDYRRPADSVAARASQRVRDLLEMIRFSHTVFALPFALLSAVLAWSTPLPDGSRVEFSWRFFVGILLCMVTGRSVAMAFNRLVDRRIDANNPRTAGRHLPAGKLSVAAVVWFTLTMAALFVVSTLLFLPNRWPLYLSIPFLLYLCGYSYTKRFSAVAHWWLGGALMLAPLGAWIAIRGAVLSATPGDLCPALGIGVAVLLWVSGFDIIYACQDAEFDRQAGLYSVPARLGVPAALRVAAICHAAMLLVLAVLPSFAAWTGTPLPLGWIYYLAVAIVAVLLIYEHWLVKPDDLTRVNVAFFQVNAVVSLGLLVAVCVDLWV